MKNTFLFGFKNNDEKIIIIGSDIPEINKRI